MMQAQVDISIILVNYKTCALLLDCLQSIYRETVSSTFEIIVVDNDSNDDSEEIIHSKYPAVQYLQMGYNAGFARANNLGIQHSKGRNILLLNTDTLIKDHALDETLKLFEAEKGYAACGLQLLNEDGSHQISGARVVKGGLNTLLPLPYLGSFVRYCGYKLKYTPPSVETVADKTDVDWIIGAFILVRKSVVEKAGMLDEDFFMYSEEMEWCARLKHQGKLCLYGKPKVIHFGGGSSKGFYQTTAWNNGQNLFNKKGLQILVSSQLRIRKEFGLGWFMLMNFFYLVEIPVFILGLLIEKITRGKRSQYKFRDLTGYIKNIFFLKKYTWRMHQAKPYFYKVN